MTLPEDVIATLTRTDDDLSRAIVRLAMPLADRPKAPPAETSRFGREAVIVVPPLPALAEIAGVDLVPLADGRVLIALADGISAADFELAVRDRLTGQTDPGTCDLLEGIAAILQKARRTDRLTTRRIMVVPPD